MNIKVFRIDDRLIHGQIVTKWIKEADNAKRILIIDDKAAKDKTLQMILKIAVPGGIELVIKTKKEGITYLAADKTDINTLLLMRNPVEANEFMNMGFMISQINLGNISNSKSITGRKKILDYIYVENTDVEALREITKKGIDIAVKAIPEEKTKDIRTLIKGL